MKLSSEHTCEVLRDWEAHSQQANRGRYIPTPCLRNRKSTTFKNAVPLNPIPSHYNYKGNQIRLQLSEY